MDKKLEEKFTKDYQRISSVRMTSFKRRFRNDSCIPFDEACDCYNEVFWELWNKYESSSSDITDAHFMKLFNSSLHKRITGLYAKYGRWHYERQINHGDIQRIKIDNPKFATVKESSALSINALNDINVWELKNTIAEFYQHNRKEGEFILLLAAGYTPKETIKMIDGRNEYLARDRKKISRIRCHFRNYLIAKEK